MPQGLVCIQCAIYVIMHKPSIGNYNKKWLVDTNGWCIYGSVSLVQAIAYSNS